MKLLFGFIWLQKILISVFFLLSLVISFYFGTHYQESLWTNRKKLATVQSQKRIDELEKEIELILEERGELIESYTQDYNGEKIGVYSPFFKGKKIEVNVFKYRRKTIIQKMIPMGDLGYAEIWEYANRYERSEIPSDFGIFGGYENYGNYATLVKDIQKSWTESYLTKNGIKMFYGYEYAPKEIAGVNLSSYHPSIPNFRDSRPIFIKVGYNLNFPGIDFVENKKDDPAILKAKKELQKLVDTITIGSPEQTNN